MVILVKRIKIDFQNHDFNEINGLLKKAVENIPKNEFIAEIRISDDRKNDEHLIAIFPFYEDSKMQIDGFEIINGTCKTCLNYAGGYTHDFIRGNGGECFADGNFHAPYDQCEWYKNKIEAFKEYHEAVKEAENKINENAEKMVSGVKEGLNGIKKTMESIVNKVKGEKEEMDDV